MVSHWIAAMLVAASAVIGQQTPPAPTSPQPAEWRAATPATETVASPKPPAPLTPEMRGDIYMARKMYREAVDAYREGPPNSPILANKIGIAHHQMQQLDTAKKQYERALKLNKNYPEAINNLGTVYYAKKSYRKATGYYNKALKLTPNSASILSNLGTAYFARKKYKDALTAYSRALEIDPEVFEHRSSQGVLLQERSVEERAKFHYFMAKTYAKAGNAERALLYMRKALEEGFKDKNKFREEEEFASLKELPEFEQLLAMEYRVL